jgi:hypothetical protein
VANYRTLLLAAVCLALVQVVSAQTFKPLRIETPPVIDGTLDEPFWASAPVAKDFVTFIPDFGKVQEQKTEVLMTYDSENLYFAFRCFDDPALVKNSLSARDAIRPDDWVCINLDTFGDQQGLTGLYVNPSGIQMDSRFAAGQEDFSADFVWYSAGRLTQDGYVVEIQLPLKSLRYADDETVTMTVFFERFISRRNEHGSNPSLDPNKGFAFLTQMTPMIYTGLEHYTLLEILPAVVFSQQQVHKSGNFHVSDVRREASLTLKYGITSDLILDGTMNPDFSQVESDAGQVDVNLRTNLFFAERRPFFLEGRENFNIGATNSGAPLQSLFHTRTIVDPLLGVKLSGKLGSNHTISTLLANDDLSGSAGGGVREAWFGFARYKMSLSGDSYVGAAYAGRDAGSAYNRVGGFDAQIRVGGGSQLDLHGFASFTRDSATGALLKGHAAKLQLQSGDRDMQYGVSVSDLSNDFRADMGFLNRTGITRISGSFQPWLYPSSSFFHKIGIGLSTTQTRDHPSSLWETSNVLYGQVQFRGNLSFNTEATYSTEVFLGSRFRTSGIFARVGGALTPWLNVTLTYRSGEAIYYSASPFQGNSRRAQATVVYQPSEQLRFDYSFIFSDFHRSSDDLQMYSYPINRLRASYQFNKYLFLRAIGEYNGFRKRMLTDFLLSFTYIPGTVLHAGYGSFYYRQEWDPGSLSYRQSNNFLETNRGLFFKASYLWRL